MNSMTGFGKAQIKTADAMYTVELSSVNSRFLEFAFRTPRSLSGLEPKIRDLVQSKVLRGKLNVNIAYERAHQEHGQYIFNQQAADAYLKQLRAYQKKRKLTGEISVTDLLSIPDIVRAPGQDIGDTALWKALKKAVGEALNGLFKMRQKEGGALAADLKKRLRLINSDLKKIEKICSGSALAHRDKILSRVNELLDGPEINRQRLEEEVALLCDKADITEEITRLKSHLDQFGAALAAKGSVGKRLNFILQEMNREVNTIGSKALSIDISKLVIGLKEEIERIREQVQNVE